MDKNKGIIEAILFAAGRDVKVSELMSALELSSDEVIGLVESMKQDYEKEDRGIQIINVDGSYQLCTKQLYRRDYRQRLNFRYSTEFKRRYCIIGRRR